MVRKHSILKYGRFLRGEASRTRLMQRCRSIGLLVLILLCLTNGLGYRFYHQPKLDVGKIAPQTVFAPASISIEDTVTTAEKRQEAQSGVFPAVQVDPAANQHIQQQLQQWLERGKQIRETLGNFPFVPTAVLSTGTQVYLRQTSTVEWQFIQRSIDQNRRIRPITPASIRTQVQAAQQRAVRELRTYRQIASPQAFEQVLVAVEQAQQRYPRALITLASIQTGVPEPLYDATFLKLSDRDWWTTQAEIRQTLTRMLAQGIHPGLSQYQLNQAIELQIQATTIPVAAQALAQRLLTTIVSANLAQDPEQTKRLAEQAAQAIEPVIVSIQAGEAIVRAGEPITQTSFVLLDHFHLSQRGINWLSLWGFGGLVGLALASFHHTERRLNPRLRLQDQCLILLLVLATPLIVAITKSFTGLPAIGLLIGSFYGAKLGVVVIATLSPLLVIGTEISWDALLPGAIAGIAGSIMAAGQWQLFQREMPRTREDLAILGVLIGVIQGIADLLIHAVIATSWYSTIGGAIQSALIGVVWSILAIGLSPYLEWLFDLITPIRLAELANPNRSLLKRLAQEAPGTFQHTQFVTLLAEAAARALNCNVELVRAGTLHHDIGKLHDPLAFIENQMGGMNKHHQINDPWESAEVIKKHVSEGLVLARQNHLPSAIQAFIPEHQGTILIAYFYHQAQQHQEQYPHRILQEADFRYDGPIPQSRETGIVMLADACEAGLRSLENATPDEALAMVNKILRARWQDQQLIDSGLTRQDLAEISHLFVQVWQQFRHKRIMYPK